MARTCAIPRWTSSSANSRSLRAARAESADLMARRTANLLGLLCCLGLLGYAWYAQAVLHLEPCPLCIFQRIGIAAIALVFLAAALHAPRRAGALVYGI